MKKLLIALIGMMAVSSAHSQFYFQAGINWSNISESSNSNKEKNDILTTFNVGFLARVKVYDPISVETGLLVNGQGSRATTYFTGSTSTNFTYTRVNPAYFQLPLNAVYTHKLQGKKAFAIHLGPYVQCGFGGTSKAEITSTAGTLKTYYTRDVMWGIDNKSTSAQEDAYYNKLRRFDFGLNFGGTFDLGYIMLKANYGWGFTNINASQSGTNDKNKYRTISLDVCFPFRHK